MQSVPTSAERSVLLFHVAGSCVSKVSPYSIRSHRTLYLIFFNYTAPLEALGRVLPARRTHLDAHYVSGHFLISGPFLPCEDGGILARAESREEINAIVTHDPFVIENLAQTRVTAWGPGRRSADVPQAWLPDAVVAAST